MKRSDRCINKNCSKKYYRLASDFNCYSCDWGNTPYKCKEYKAANEMKSAELMHFDLLGLLDDPCFGTMVQEPVYKNGQLVNRLWHCESCGETYTESEVVKIEEEHELVRV